MSDLLSDKLKDIFNWVPDYYSLIFLINFKR